MKYRTKPVVIEAVQFTQEMREAYHFDGGMLPEGVVACGSHIHARTRHIHFDRFGVRTPAGVLEIRVGDWVITPESGSHYPCESDIFDASFEVEQ